MSSISALETLIDDVKKAFADAKSDGKLEAAEVVQIAGDVAKKVFLIGTGTTVEKKALILHALQKGLAAAGGLQGLAVLKVAGPAGLAAAEKQILSAAMASVEGLLNIAPQLFEPVRGCLSALKGPLSKLLPFCSQAASIAAALSPKDAKLIQEALGAYKAVVGVEPPPSELSSTPESLTVREPAHPAKKDVQDISGASVPGTAPSQEASAQVAPAQTLPEAAAAAAADPQA
jgi:hypothetical protein